MHNGAHDPPGVIPVTSPFFPWETTQPHSRISALGGAPNLGLSQSGYRIPFPAVIGSKVVR